MSKKVIGINEIIIIAAIVVMLSLLAIRFFDPGLLVMPFFNTAVGAFLLGCFSAYFSYDQYKAFRSEVEWGANRVSGFIRTPLYLAASLFLFYIAATGGISTQHLSMVARWAGQP